MYFAPAASTAGDDDDDDADDDDDDDDGGGGGGGGGVGGGGMELDFGLCKTYFALADHDFGLLMLRRLHSELSQNGDVASK
nr:unnamed protein product [Spirometra erinaceieuropaei]